jgi:hypothetical protein
LTPPIRFESVINLKAAKALALEDRTRSDVAIRIAANLSIM